MKACAGMRTIASKRGDGGRTITASSQHPLERAGRHSIQKTVFSRGLDHFKHDGIVVTSTETHFAVHATLNAYEKEQLVFNRQWSLEIPRDHV